VIVSDGSSDKVASSYSRKHSFVRLLKTGDKGQKEFGRIDVRCLEIVEEFRGAKLGIGGGLILELIGHLIDMVEAAATTKSHVGL
jgi:hypothetical protein